MGVRAALIVILSRVIVPLFSVYPYRFRAYRHAERETLPFKAYTNCDVLLSHNGGSAPGGVAERMSLSHSLPNVIEPTDNSLISSTDQGRVLSLTWIGTRARELGPRVKMTDLHLLGLRDFRLKRSNLGIGR